MLLYTTIWYATYLGGAFAATTVTYATYEPVTLVTDHAGIAGDQAIIEKYTEFQNEENFAIAEKVHEMGGNSKSYAELYLRTALPKTLAMGTNITGVNRKNTQITGKALQDYPAGSFKIGFQYPVKDHHVRYLTCKVGALPEEDQVTRGCLQDTGYVSITGFDNTFAYTASYNKNARTIESLSTGADIGFRPGNDLEEDYFPFFKPYVEYYGTYDFAHQMAMAGFDGEKTAFGKGDIDLTGYGFTARAQIAKKATAYINLALFAQREMFVAIYKCNQKCTTPECNDYSLHKLDEAVAFYVGNQLDGDINEQGNLAYGLAEIRCSSMATCENGIDGESIVNKKIMAQFEDMKSKMLDARCAACQENADEIVRLMTIPHIQGTLRYAQRTESFAFPSESMQAEGAIFAAAILPKVNACSSAAADVIYNNMKLTPDKNSKADFGAVKRALEEVYGCLRVSCAEIGGVVNEITMNTYVKGAEPCGKVNNLASSAQVLSRSLFVGAIAAVAIVWM
ncbi:hypothetical protein ACA910_012766 [Epithemia clementina (nom. ined.)]